MKNISIIAAMANNNAIGFNKSLIYHLPDDLKRFKRLTDGKTVIMGRKTFESLPNGALKNRRNIVLSKTNIIFNGVEMFNSLEKAIASCEENEEIFIIGGESIYKQSLPIANKMYITVIDDTPENANSFFPKFNEEEWEMINEERHVADNNHKYKFKFIDYIKKNSKKTCTT